MQMMAPVPISRLNIESSGAKSGALTGSKTFRLRASLREGDAVFFHLNGEERPVALHKQVDFLLIVVAEEVERCPLAGVEEALVDLPKDMGFEDLPAHGTGFKSLRTGPSREIRCQSGVEKMHDRLFGKLATTIRSKVLAGKTQDIGQDQILTARRTANGANCEIDECFSAGDRSIS